MREIISWAFVPVICVVIGVVFLRVDCHHPDVPHDHRLIGPDIERVDMITTTVDSVLVVAELDGIGSANPNRLRVMTVTTRKTGRPVLGRAEFPATDLDSGPVEVQVRDGKELLGTLPIVLFKNRLEFGEMRRPGDSSVSR